MSFTTVSMTNTAGIVHTFNETASGIYMLAGLSFGEPPNGVKISPARKSGNGPTAFSVTRFIEFAVPELTKNSKLSVSLNVSVPKEANTGMIDDCVSGINSWLTPTTINELLLGRS